MGGHDLSRGSASATRVSARAGVFWLSFAPLRKSPPREETI